MTMSITLRKIFAHLGCKMHCCQMPHGHHDHGIEALGHHGDGCEGLVENLNHHEGEAGCHRREDYQSHREERRAQPHCDHGRGAHVHNVKGCLEILTGILLGDVLGHWGEISDPFAWSNSSLSTFTDACLDRGLTSMF